MNAKTEDRIFTGIGVSVFLVFFIGMVWWAIVQSNNAERIQNNEVRCDTIGAIYVDQINKCVKDGEILPIPGS